MIFGFVLAPPPPQNQILATPLSSILLMLDGTKTCTLFAISPPPPSVFIPRGCATSIVFVEFFGISATQQFIH